MPNPLLANGLRLWFRADFALSKDSAGRVSAWRDIASGDTTLLQGEAARQPLWLSGAFNGNDAIQFDRSARQALATPNLIDLQGGSRDATVIAVIRPETTQPYRSTIVDANHEGGSGFVVRQEEGATNAFNLWWYDVAANEQRSGVVSAGADRVQVLTLIKSGTMTTGFLNSVAQTSLPVDAAILPPLTTFAVGNQVAPYYGFNGEIAEVLVYNRALPDSERQQLETQLETKYISIDSDGDGLPDQWELRYLGTLGWGANDDPGVVGRTLLQSYQTGQSPWPTAPISSGLRAWYRADVGITKDASDSVSQWADLSGNGFHVIQTADVARQPLWLSGAFNGNAALQFSDSARQALKTPGLADLHGGSTDVTVIAVVRPQASQPYQSTILDADHAGGGGIALRQEESSTNTFHFWWEDLAVNEQHSGGLTTDAGQVEILTLIKNGALTSDYLNGTAQSISPVNAAMLTPIAALAIGNQVAPYYGFSGQIAEILVYNRALTTTERQQIERSIKAKYINHDSDADGLPDEWELKYLGTLRFSANDDPGAVGRTLLQSFQQGLSPWPTAVVSSGLSAWYRGDLGVMKDLNNKVSQWADLSGNAFHVIQTADLARQPLWVGSAMNGSAAIQFDGGARQVLKTPGLIDLTSGGTDVTVIAVIKADAAQPYRSTILDADHDGFGGIAVRENEGATNSFNLWWDDSAANEQRGGRVTSAPNRAQVLSFVKNGGNAIEYIDGRLQNTSSVTTSLSAPATGLAIGNQVAPYYGFSGQIAEILVYNRTLSDDELQQVDAQLKTKYVSLDSDGDALPDAWELGYLGTLSYGANDDPGGVGRTLLQSYQAGLSPWPTALVTAGLRAWYRADLGISKDSSGNVSTWTDVSGNGLHVTQTTDLDRQPQWLGAALNGHAVVQFSGGLQVLTTPGLVDLQAGSSDVTIITVLKPQSTQPYRSTILDSDHDGRGGIGVRQDEGSTNQIHLWWEDGAANEGRSGGATLIPDQAQVLAVVKSGPVVADYLNGSFQTSTICPSTISAPLAVVALGNQVSPFYGFSGQIAEMFVYNRALSDTELLQMGAALKTKYIDAATSTPATPLFSIDFETSEGFSLGSLDGQNGWSASWGTAQVVADSSAPSGAKEISVDANSAVAFRLTPAPSGLCDVDFYARPVAGSSSYTATQYRVGDATVALVVTGDGRQAEIYTGSSGFYIDSFAPTGTTVPIGPDKRSDWLHFFLKLDFTHRNWSLYLNSTLVASNSPMESLRMNTLQVVNNGPTPALFDRVKGAQEWVAPDPNADNDGNGLPDNWEKLHFGHTGVDPNADPDGDGRSNLKEYQDGTDPNVFDTKATDSVLWLISTDATSNARYALENPGILSSFGQFDWNYGAPFQYGPVEPYRYNRLDITNSVNGSKGTSFYGYDGTLWDTGNQALNDRINIAHNFSPHEVFLAIQTNAYYSIGLPVRLANEAYDGTINDIQATYKYFDTNGTHQVVATLSAKQYDQLYKVSDASETVSPPAPSLDAPTAFAGTSGSVATKYRLIVPAGWSGSVHWMIVFTPEGDAEHKIFTPLSWTIDDTKSPEFTLDPAVLNPGKYGAYEVVLYQATLAVDANRDGNIVPETLQNANNPETDKTTSVKPYRFWLNDDDDHGSTIGDIGTEHTPAVRPDYSINLISSQRDLEDYARLWINLSGLQGRLTGPNATLQLGLKWADLGKTGTPAIKLYPGVEIDGGTQYLTDSTANGVAQQQASQYAVIDQRYANEDPGSSTHTTISGPNVFILPKSLYANLNASQPNLHLLFEGAGVGQGQLVIVILDASGNPIGEGSGVWMDLKNIKSMYQRGVADAQNTNIPFQYTGNPPGPNVTMVPDPYAGFSFQQPRDETAQCTVMVHGFNVTPEQAVNRAETMFKRLWWRGYKGRLAAFRWPAIGFANGTVPAGAVGTYNDSEYLAWNSGAALKQFAATMPSGYALNFVAHSQGNLVVGQALREGMPARHYAMLHAATSASCYSNASFTYTVSNTDKTTPDNDQDYDFATRNLAYTGWLGRISGGPVNFYDSQDSVVGALWNVNNTLFKPQHYNGWLPSILGVGTAGYDYDTIMPVGYRLRVRFSFDPDRLVTDPAEAKAYADHSLTGTIGLGNNGTKGGAIIDSVDDSNFGDEHSSEWDRNIQQLLPFYNALMVNLGAIPNS